MAGAWQADTTLLTSSRYTYLLIVISDGRHSFGSPPCCRSCGIGRFAGRSGCAPCWRGRGRWSRCRPPPGSPAAGWRCPAAPHLMAKKEKDQWDLCKPYECNWGHLIWVGWELLTHGKKLLWFSKYYMDFPLCKKVVSWIRLLIFWGLPEKLGFISRANRMSVIGDTFGSDEDCWIMERNC